MDIGEIADMWGHPSPAMHEMGNISSGWWKRAIIVLSSIPLAIVVNGLRIAVIGVLYSWWGAEVAEGFFHGFSSWLIFLAMIPFLLAEMWLLRRIGR